MTRIGEAGVPDDVWDDTVAAFDDAEVVHLVMAICAINVWNRMAITTHQQLPDREPDL